MGTWVDYIKQLKDMYDDKIEFREYWYKIYPDREFKFPCACDLHDEKEGHSFSYSERLNVWSCWGHCRARGKKVVEYHYRYLKKNNPNVTYVYAMEQLCQLFPNLGLPHARDASNYFSSKVIKNKESETSWANKIRNSLSKVKKSVDDMPPSSIVMENDITMDSFKIFTNHYLTKMDMLEERSDLDVSRSDVSVNNTGQQ